MKARIYKNRWDNWYVYIGSKRVIAFSNSTTQTQEQQAEEWLRVQEALFLLAPQRKRCYQERVCIECGATITEGAYSGKDGNFKKHVASHS